MPVFRPTAELDSGEKVLVEKTYANGSFGKDNLPKKTFHKVQGEVLQVDESKADQ